MSRLIARENRISTRNATFVLIAAYALLLILSRAAYRLNTKLMDLFSLGLYALPILATFIACIWASRNTKSYKRLWQMMAVGIFFWLAGAITIIIYAATLGSSNIPSPSIADAFSIAYLPIMFGILLSLGKIKPPFDTKKKQFLVNVAIASLSVFLLCYEFILMPILSNPNIGLVQKIFTVAYPLYDWTVFVMLLLASFRLQNNQVEGWLALLITAFAFSILGDVASYITGDQLGIITTLMMISAAILLAISAIDEVTGVYVGIISRQAKSNESLNAKAPVQNPWQTMFIPFTFTMVIPIAWLASLHGNHGKDQLILIIVSIIIILLSVYRNHLLASDNAVLFAKSLRDTLTGLNNHRYFQEVLNKAIKKADRTHKPISLLVLDIDNFSQLNNAYGHVLGDRVLTTIGSVILSEVRENDEACRLSGDEFGIILPKTTNSQALKIAGRIKQKISSALVKAFPEKTITITIGISVYPTLAQDKDELLHTTDGALYWAKFHGKNSVLLYDPKVVETLSAEERAKRVEEIAMIDMVRSLANAVDVRDPYTRLHSKRVSYLSKKLARFIGLDDAAVNRIEIAGILHDVGKIGIPDNILNKPGRLTEQEMMTVKNHPVLSAQIIKSTSLKEIIPAVKAHHERWDGNGYPLGLIGEKIPLEARILAIADSFDAMTSDRPYRKGLTAEEALREIKRCGGSQFDPQLTKDFLSMFKYYDFISAPEDSYEDQTDFDYNQAIG